MAVRKSDTERERVANEALDALLGKKKPDGQPTPPAETSPKIPEATLDEIQSSEATTSDVAGSGLQSQSESTSLSDGSHSTSDSTSVSESTTSESQSAVSTGSLVGSHSTSAASESTSIVTTEPASVTSETESDPTPVVPSVVQPETDPEAPTNIMALLAAQKKTKVGQYLRLDVEVKDALDQLTKQTDANGKKVRVPGTNGLISDIAQNGIVRELHRIGLVDDEFVRKFMIAYDR